jgi:hypothetical protein
MAKPVNMDTKALNTLLTFAIILTVIFGAWGVTRIVKWVVFDINCAAYIKRAADANTVDIAKTELAKAIDFAESKDLTEGIVYVFIKNPANDIGFWYQNMVAAHAELVNLPADSTALEQTNVLMKLRESLTDNAGDSTSVTVPSGIEIYPHNVAYFWWGLLSGVGAFLLWSVWGVGAGHIAAEVKTDKGVKLAVGKK